MTLLIVILIIAGLAIAIVEIAKRRNPDINLGWLPIWASLPIPVLFVLYWLFSTVLLVAGLFFRKNLIKSMMSGQIDAPDGIWKKLLTGRILFFLFMGAINLFVAFSYSTDIWVSFKLFGGIGLMLLFVVAQAFVLAPHIKDKEAE